MELNSMDTQTRRKREILQAFKYKYVLNPT